MTVKEKDQMMRTTTPGSTKAHPESNLTLQDSECMRTPELNLGMVSELVNGADCDNGFDNGCENDGEWTMVRKKKKYNERYQRN